MVISEEEIKAIKEELKWIELNEYTTEKEKNRGILGILVPLGCVVTAGVLGTGLYYLRKGDSKKQQMMMRLRVLSQGVTAAFAAIGILSMATSKSVR